MYNTLIFDLDGTLLNTLEDLANACNYALTKLEFKTHKIEDYTKFIGGGRRKLIERILPESNSDIEIVEKTVALFDEYYSKHMIDMTKPYDGIEDLLSELKEKNYNLAVVSNKPHKFTVDVVEKYFKDIFAVVYGQRDNVEVKPNPASVYEVIEDFNVGKEQCIYIGDSDIDMHTAINADVTSIGVAWGFRGQQELEEAGADHIISHPSEMIKLIKSIEKY